jgi:RNA polymerase sigma factor (sigma-70 family)
MIKLSSKENEQLCVLALLVRIKGSPAFATLSYKTAPLVRSWLGKWIHIKEDREDLEQDIWIKLQLTLQDGKYKGGQFSAFLFRLVQRMAIDFLRKRKMQFVDAQPWVNMADKGTAPALLMEEICKKAESTVKNLPEGQRAVFEQRVLEKKSFAEIGKQQGGRAASDMSSVYCKAQLSIRVSMMGPVKARALKLREKNFRTRDANTGMRASI